MVTTPSTGDGLWGAGAYAGGIPPRRVAMADVGMHRVLVIDDDTVAAWQVEQILLNSGCEVRVINDPTEAQAEVRSFDPDVVVTDIEMPGMTGIELMAQLDQGRPDLRFIVITAHISVDYAVSALRGDADELLTKPIDAVALVSAVGRLAEEGRRVRAGRGHRVVLAIGAHPDDVEIGVGGTLAAHRAAKNSVVILTLSRGGRGGDVDSRQSESMEAAELLGARLFLENLVDTRIALSSETLDIIERVVAEVRPDIVYTHSLNDRHQDHRATHEATMVATRTIPLVGCYQSPSSTVDFRPNQFVTIDDYTDIKLELLACYRSQSHLRDYLDPDFVRATARYWSRFGTGISTEPLEIIRDAGAVALPDVGASGSNAATEWHQARA